MPHLPERKSVKYDWKTLTDYHRDELNINFLVFLFRINGWKVSYHLKGVRAVVWELLYQTLIYWAYYEIFLVSQKLSHSIM